MQLKERLFQLTQERYHLTPDQCDDHQLYEALLLLTRALGAKEDDGLRGLRSKGNGPSV